MSSSRQERKHTQHERLLAGMLSAAVRNGYAGASVAEVIAQAGVSRPTFYEYFPDRDACFLAVHEEISSQLIERVGDAVDAVPPERAVQAGVSALILRAEAKPDRARFLVNETLAGGPRVLDQRDRTIARIEHVIERARARAPLDSATPDVPTRAVIGGICGLLAPRLRRNEHDFRALAQEIAGWLDRYCHPTAQHRWRTLGSALAPPPPAQMAELPLRAPPPLAPGRPSIPSAEVARNQRERIIYATAEVAARKGYAGATVADITTAAGVDRRVFYTNFRDKQQAFLAVHELGFQHLMAACASAFFNASSWPERVWEGLRAGTHFDASYPVLAHIGYVESHAVGQPAIQRVEDSHAAFTIFMQEGYLHASVPPPRSVLDAIAATIFETGYQHARTGRIQELPNLTAHATYLVLAPFIGRDAANEFVDEKLAELRAQPSVELQPRKQAPQAVG